MRYNHLYSFNFPYSKTSIIIVEVDNKKKYFNLSLMKIYKLKNNDIYKHFTTV